MLREQSSRDKESSFVPFYFCNFGSNTQSIRNNQVTGPNTTQPIPRTQKLDIFPAVFALSAEEK